MRLKTGLIRFREALRRDPVRAARYAALAKDGQAPEDYMITCSDSRVVPHEFTQAGPGELFISRNAGNFVPPYQVDTPSAAQAALGFGITALKVKRVIVCGHTDCGALKSLLSPEAVTDMPALSVWLDPFKALLDEVRGLPKAEAMAKLTEHNVRLQMEHVRTHPAAASRLAAGDLELSGWIFDIATGEVRGLDADTDTFVPLN